MGFDESDQLLESGTATIGWDETPDIIESALTAMKAPQRISFFDLPAELRDTIYDLAVNHLCTARCLKYRKLPLAQVFRQFRHEFLARYYRTITFNLSLDRSEVVDPEASIRGLIGNLLISRDASKWLSVFGDCRVPLVRRLRFQGGAVNVLVELATAARPTVVEVGPEICTRQSATFKTVHKPAIEIELRNFLAAATAKDDDGLEYITKSVLVELMDRIQAHERSITSRDLANERVMGALNRLLGGIGDNA